MILSLDAIKNEKVQVKMSVYDMYEAILKSLGVEGRVGYYTKLEGNELVTYRDISTHGSPDFERVDAIKLEDDELNVLATLLDLKKDIKSVSKRLEIKCLQAEKAILDVQIKNLQ